MNDTTSNGGRLLAALLALTLSLGGLSPALAASVWDPLVNRLAADGFDRARLAALFARPEVAFNDQAMGAKLTELYMRKYGLNVVREAQQRLMELGWHPGPADGRIDRTTTFALKAWQRAAGLPEDGKIDQALLQRLRADARRAPAGYATPRFTTPVVYESAVTPERLAEARRFYEANKAALARLEAETGTPPGIAVGILSVETKLGTFLGGESALVNLASMALAEDYAKVAHLFAAENPGAKEKAFLIRKAAEKGQWAYGELKALLRYAASIGRDPATMPGSIYGAIGISQFMPSNALRFARDGDGDGKADLFVLADALASMGDFLRRIGYRPGLGQEDTKKVLMGYNRSQTYVNTIWAVSESLGRPGAAGAVQ